MQVIPLGAGQDVGRSCIIITVKGRTIMLDCGLHMGFNDNRKFPDFSYLSKNNRNLSKLIDCIIISHFHMDHCGALPYFTETIGYNGPIYMTHPTRAICPILLEDYRKIALRQKTKGNLTYTSQEIKECMNKVRPVNFYETFEHDKDFIIKAYPAGHVIGAAMFYVKIKDESFVYTGDYNLTPDRHLSAASIDCLRPNLLITESTYGSLIRDCRKAKERDFLNSVYEVVKKGGKVLIPIFALGRAQEMCLLIDSYWERMNLSNIPIYLTTGMAEKATQIYRLFINYTNETIRKKIKEQNLFDFKHIKPLEMHKIDEAGPMVIFASPGMLHSGNSLNIFLKLCHDSKNMVIIPGYCVRGTIGEKILSGEKVIEYNKRKYEVNIKIKNLAFSAHADAKGIMDLIKMCQPKNVTLVHGDKNRMVILKEKVEKEFGVSCFMPGNGTIINIPTSDEVRFRIPKDKLEELIEGHKSEQNVNLKITAVEDEDGYKIIECSNFIQDNTKL